MTDDPDSSNALPAATLQPFGRDGGYILQRLEGSELIGLGQVNVIVLDAIAERLGLRWEAKRWAVYDHVERVLERSVGTSGYFARVSDTDFLVVHPELGQHSAQASAYRAFQEIWRYFLGDAPRPDLTVHRVTELSQQHINAVPLSLEEALAGEAREIETMANQTLAEDRSLLSLGRWSPFVATDGRKVKVSCSLEPVYNLKTQSRIGFRLRRKVIDLGTGVSLSVMEVAALSRSDLLRIDMATMARGIGRLESEVSEKAEQSLIIPVSYISVAHHQSRLVIAQALALARKAVRTGVICEIYDSEDVPQGPLLEAISWIRPWSLLVTAHVQKPPGRGMKDTGLRAVSISCPGNLVEDADFVTWAKPLIRTSKHVTHSVMIYRCGTSRRLAIAGALGASHGTMK